MTFPHSIHPYPIPSYLLGHPKSLIFCHSEESASMACNIACNNKTHFGHHV